MTIEELDLMVDGYLEGSLGPDQVEAFDTYLQTHPEAVDWFVRTLTIHQVLQSKLGVGNQADLQDLVGVYESGADGLPEEQLIQEMVLQDALKARQKREIELRADALLLSQQKNEAAEAERRRLLADSDQEKSPKVIIIPKMAVWLSTAAAMLLIVALFYQYSQSSPSEFVKDDAKGEIASPVPVAQLVGELNAQWEGMSPDDAGLLFPGQYTLASGWAQIQTDYGVELVLESPVHIVVESENEIALTAGGLVASVPERAKGFAVHTPTGKVIDYGTKFGVAVGRSEETLVHVFKGEVEAASGNPDSDDPIRLTANQAAEVRHDGSVEAKASAARHFVQEMPETEYEALVLRSRPMCYWRGPIDEETRLLADHGWLGAHGQASASLRNDPAGFTSTDTSGALNFGRRDDAFVSTQTNEALVLKTSFTVEAWCWIEPEHEGFMRIVSTRAEASGFGFGVNGKDSDHSAINRPANVPIFTFFREADFIGDVVLPEGRWVHLAAVVDSDGQVAMFVDGSSIKVQKVIQPNSSAAVVKEAALAIGRNPFLQKGIQAWQGQLDEVAIYDHALSGDAILGHYQALNSP